MGVPGFVRVSPCSGREAFLALFVACVLVGCNEGAPQRSSVEERPAVAPVLTEHRFQESLTPGAKAVGESCSAGGTADCASGVCLHVGSRRDTGYLCSQHCAQSAECPSGWSCGQVHPSDSSARLCIPPSDAR